MMKRILTLLVLISLVGVAGYIEHNYTRDYCVAVEVTDTGVIFEDQCGYTWYWEEEGFEIGDVVYMYVCNRDGEARRIRYKTIVEAVHLTERVDKGYWHIPISSNESCLLRLVEEYEGTALDEEEIKKHGFKDFNAGSAKLVKGELLLYIEDCFSV